MLKVNDEFLDFNDFVEMEKRVKLFEQIDETLGDFSYAFNLTKTSKNMRILGNPFPDVKDKRIYREVVCDLLDESGLTVYRGVLKVERVSKEIECSFFSGNYNWMSLISGDLADIDFSDLDTQLTRANIVNSWDNTEGIIFPLFDAGPLITRRYKSTTIQDFVGCIFVKTIFKRIFNSVSIKTTGELFNDAVFNNLLISKANIGINILEPRTSYAGKTSTQFINFDTFDPPGTLVNILFPDDSTFPFFDGALDNYSIVTSRYTADVAMIVNVDVSVRLTTNSDPSYTSKIFVYKNGTDKLLPSSVLIQENETNESISWQINNVKLEAGDYLAVYMELVTGSGGPGTRIITLHSGSFKVTPTYAFFSTGNSLVPTWTKQQLVSNILALFCVVSDYDPYTKTITFNFFENIKQKEPIDISQYVSELQEDYSDFISNFFKNSQIKYQPSNDEQVEGYNNARLVKYGAGVIEVNNDYIEKEGAILDSDFKAPVSYVNGAFAASLERTNFLDLEENEQDEFTGVTDASGVARFSVADETIYNVGDLIRISDSTDDSYNGDFVVSDRGSGFITVYGGSFSSNATGTIHSLLYKIGSDDGVYLFINAKAKSDLTGDFSAHSEITLEVVSYARMGYAFFNILNTGLQISTDYKQGLSFGDVDNPQSDQRTLIDKYWGVVSRVLNDPVKVECIGHLPKIVFDRITPLRPIRIKTETTNNLYYLNRIGGYKESYLPCEVDLIKLS